MTIETVGIYNMKSSSKDNRSASQGTKVSSLNNKQVADSQFESEILASVGQRISDPTSDRRKLRFGQATLLLYQIVNLVGSRDCLT